MKHTHGGEQEQGADTDDYVQPEELQRGRGRSKLSATSQMPKNRSASNNLAVDTGISTFDTAASRVRFSFDGSSSAVAALQTDYESMTRSPLITDHDHGLGISGLRRIRQQPSSRTPTLPPSAASSRSPSVSLARSSSLIMLPSYQGSAFSSGPGSPGFGEDLTRFPTESLHSFSFAHQPDDFHNRQNVLKRSIEFLKDRMGWAASSNAALASAHARVSGDMETQNMLDFLARAQLVEAGNLPHGNDSALTGPLTGPAEVGDNVFDKTFIPRTDSPDSFLAPDPPPPLHVQDVPAQPKLEPLSSTTQQVKSGGDGESAESAGATKASKPKIDSDSSSRTPTNESGTTNTTSQSSPPPEPSKTETTDKSSTSPTTSRKLLLRRTYTDVAPVDLQHKLMDAMSRPFMNNRTPTHQDSVLSPLVPPPLHLMQSGQSSLNVPGSLGSSVRGCSSRWTPAAQAIFTTEAKPPWTILAANDLACLVFGVTKAEVRRMGILEVVQEERRSWLETMLLRDSIHEVTPPTNTSMTTSATTSLVLQEDIPKSTPAPSGAALLGGRGGITAHLLSKPNSRSQPRKPTVSVRRAQTVHSGNPSKPRVSSHHSSSKSRGVLLCGDVVPIQKRNGATGSASLWVKEKKVGLIWVLEEIHEDVVMVGLDDDGLVTKITGATEPICGGNNIQPGNDIGTLITRIPRQGIDPRFGAVDYAQISKRKYFTCQSSSKANVPVMVAQTRGQMELRVSSFPHIAGIVVVNPNTLMIRSSNSVFCGALFGYEKADGLSINALIPDFDSFLQVLTQQEGLEFEDGMVVPEHSFRKAAAFQAVRQGKPDAANLFLNPESLSARHRDGSVLKLDVQMRVVKSEKQSGHDSGSSDDDLSPIDEPIVTNSEPDMVYALWITYSRHLHASKPNPIIPGSPLLSGSATPLHQPSPGQTPAHTPQDMNSDSEEPKKQPTPLPPPPTPSLTQQLKDVALSAAAKLTGSKSDDKSGRPNPVSTEPPATKKKSIDDFVILEDMGQGAYGQVKLVRYKHDGGKKVVLKYVTKRRILVDTWTRDRRLGTVPLEIHVLEYLRRDGFKHPNIVEMEDFFEDDTNYYIEMAPHGLPGMDLFDYIELRTNMEEDECRSIFVQVAKAVQHLHMKVKVVHRDIKDENVVLDGEGNIKLIDFGSAAYIKGGPFDVFVGTIDYAAPEVLAGKPYRGKEQDVWALGILLYTIIYKENPFYSIDEILDRDLRVPYTISDDSINLIRGMLNRDVAARYDINQVLNHPWCRGSN